MIQMIKLFEKDFQSTFIKKHKWGITNTAETKIESLIKDLESTSKEIEEIKKTKWNFRSKA